ncbi:hypothetical protein N7495_003562 [Penicillium taxi]|uniref:uncharacterized protein n=1 Tax=Penicillium taxi TaxID=168475 RepID=UPI002544F5D6|nr:uncharacterized protein N7495_003562 [Penicillium taxi]KAJ5898818.1 hypothetical protein N7495_003562 [Penicillium taxi]
MAYFLPSFFQKRLLKYALSRLGVVDTEDLDLDNLGIQWGQRSTVELRDIGLKLNKLATLLSLPETFELLSARIHFLRLTVPADIYSSGIICEADGINVHVRCLSEDYVSKHGKHENSTEKQPYMGVHGSLDEQILPTPTRLAESFLESEPSEEKEELQAAISSQSHVLQNSSSFGDEEEEELGLGGEMSLPSFVAGFLKGVADRLQLKIKNVSVRLDMELEQDGPSKKQPEYKSDLVSGFLTLGEVEVLGVSGFTANSDGSLPFKEGKRLVSLVDFNAGLVSDPAVFANYSHFTAPASPTTTRSKESQSTSRDHSPPLDSPSPENSMCMTQSTIFDPLPELSRVSIADHELESSAISHDGRFSDADSEIGDRAHHYSEDSQLLGHTFEDNPGYLDSVIETQLDDFGAETPSFFEPQRHPIEESHAILPDGNSSLHAAESIEEHENADSSGGIIGTGTHISQHGSQFGLEPADMAASIPYSHRQEEGISSLQMSDPGNNPLVSAPPSESGSEDSASSAMDAHLTESKFFSHDEAQSLYMSAISRSAGASFMPNMPGAWDSFHDRDAEHDQKENANSTNAAEVSTPKSTVPSDTYFGDHQSTEEKQTQFEASATERASAASSPYLHKISEMRKPIINIDKIFIWLPSTLGEQSVEPSSIPTGLDKSDIDSVNLASGLGESRIEENILASEIFASTRLSGVNRLNQQQNNPESDLTQLEAEVFSVAIHFDIATGWLLTKACQKVSQVLGAAETPRSQRQPSSDQTTQFSIKLSAREISIKFLEHLSGQPHSLESTGSPLPPYTSIEDIVLKATVSGLKTYLSVNEKATQIQIGIAKVAFGFGSDDLISFNESLKMRESTRDVMSPSQEDISLTLTKFTESVKLDVTTLPLHLNLNIQRLEEVLGWVGGLSTIIELGSSISSASTMKGGPIPPRKRPRGVHFETPAPASDKDHASSAPLKVNARIGGIVLDVTGETHYLKLTTTAVKMVSRFEGIGVQIDKARLSGPHSLTNFVAAPAKVTLTNIRIEHLFTPKEVDLDRLLTLITPSQDKYDDDDDIMLDTLLRQRRQGSVLRVTVAGMKTTISNIGGMAPLSSLGSEMSRLSNVTKYLPEDDRPGLLTLTLIRDFEAHVQMRGEVGDINAHLTNVEVGYISMPSLLATQIGTMNVNRNEDEELMGEASLPSKDQSSTQPHPPAFMARFIPDEMDPTFKIKLHHLRIEYTIPSIMAFLGLGCDTTGTDIANEMANSISNIAEHSSRMTAMSSFSSPISETSRSPKPMKLAVVFRDSVLGLNPRNSQSKGLLVLTNAKFSGALHADESSDATLDIRKASVMIIDDVRNAGSADNLRQRSSAATQSSQVQAYIDEGYVPVTTISSAMVVVKMMHLIEDGTKSLDVELRDDLLILETCADSTQTLISILNGLQPPTPPSVIAKYRTEVMPIQDMLASFTGDAFTTNPTQSVRDNHTLDVVLEDDLNDELEYVSDFYPGPEGTGIDDEKLHLQASGANDPLDSFHSQYQVSSSLSELDFQDDHFARQSAVGGTAHRWNSTYNTYGLTNDKKLQRSPLRVRIRDMHIIWNLFDGYDWQRTRDTISKAVNDVEIKATERRARASPETEEDEESVIGDFLFNSIYIGIPANKDPRELHREINRDINDLASETGSYATTTTITGGTSRPSRSRPDREKNLRLRRSKHHKMTFELRGVCADLVAFPPGSGETQSSLDVRVRDLEIFDHVPTSTWKKFATYMHEAGERESGTSMIHLEVLTVKPVPELAASEIVLKATVLPIRLIVDQDALDFMSRFFEFRDESVEVPSTPGDIPFLQRVEVNAIQVKLDFKPKRVDYAGLRSGRTTEMMNFFVLDGADMVLRHVIIYGVSGFDRLGVSLNDIWMPDVKRNQLPGVLAGLAPIRSLVNVGGGVKDLVVIPMREYKKDGRIVRSIQKGALAFAKTTSSELVKMGAKLAIGTQTALQGAEEMLTSPTGASGAPDEDWDDDEEAKKISPYADQPIGVVQGLRGAFSGLERDLLLARDAIVAVPGEVVESGSAKAAAKAVWKRAPTVILRPAIGVSKALGQTLLGAGNTLDPSNRRKMEDKYKHH